jgi:glycosyltransferase involved in cell wall biosynthesis
MQKQRLTTCQLCLEYTPAFGGSASAVRDYALALESNVVAFTLTKTPDRPNGWSRVQVRDVPVSTNLLGQAYTWSGDTRALQEAKFILQGSKLMVMHLLYRYHIQWGAGVAKSLGLPYWVIPHGGLDPYVFTYRSLQKRLWMKFLGLRIMKQADTVVFATEGERRKASPYTAGCNTQVVYLPIDFIDTINRDSIRQKIRSQLKIPATDRILIWLGRLHPMKRLFETIQAIGVANNTSVHLLIIGPDETISRDDCVRFSEQWQIKNIHVLGPIYGIDKYNYFMASDGFISLSHRENYNYALVEALACGLPVILSPGNDLSVDLDDQKHELGWMLKAFDEHEAVEAILSFASVPQSVLLDMGRAGQKWARQNLGRERFTSRIQELANETIRKRDREFR